MAAEGEEQRMPLGPAEEKNESMSSSESETSENEEVEEEAPQVEWLATTREKRSTAGNRMKSMLAAEEPDDELELLFAEDEDDAGFSDVDDGDSDVHMDSSSDDEDAQNQGGEDEGEQELQKQLRERKLAARKRKAQEAIPMKFRKKARVDPTATSASTAIPAPRHKKRSERASWLPTPADLPTRASKRETTMLSKEALHQQMVEREAKRLKQIEAMERKAKKMEALKKPPMTQAERLAEAAIVEKRNAKSLNRWEEAEKQREEERRAKLAALNNRQLSGPVVTFWSGMGEWVDGKLKQLGKIVTIEEKPIKKRLSTVGTGKLSETNDKDEDGENEPEKDDAGKNKPEKVDSEKNKPEKDDSEKNKPGKVDSENNMPEKVDSEQNQPEKVDSEKNKPEKDESEKNEPRKDLSEKNEPRKDESEKNEPRKDESEKNELVKNESGKDEQSKEATTTPHTTATLINGDKLASNPEDADITTLEDSQMTEAPSALTALPSSDTETIAASDVSQLRESEHQGTEQQEGTLPVVVRLEAQVSVPTLPTPEIPETEPTEIQQPSVKPAEPSPPQVRSSEPNPSDMKTPDMLPPTTSTYTTSIFAPPTQPQGPVMKPPEMKPPSNSFLAPPPGATNGLSMPIIGYSSPAAQPSNVLAPPNPTQRQSPLSMPQTNARPPPPPPSMARPAPLQPPPRAVPKPTAGPATKLPAQITQPSPKPLGAVKPSHTNASKKAKEQSSVPDLPPSPRPPPPPNMKATRNSIILQNFDENAIEQKSVQQRILFGKETGKLAKQAPPPKCIITNRPARYKDPKTGLPYYDSKAYKEIQKLQRGDYKWSRLVGAWVGTGSFAAQGVPARFLDPDAPAPPKPAPLVKQEPAGTPEQTKPAVVSVSTPAPAMTPSQGNVQSLRQPTPALATTPSHGNAQGLQPPSAQSNPPPPTTKLAATFPPPPSAAPVPTQTSAVPLGPATSTSPSPAIEPPPAPPANAAPVQ